MLFCNWRKKKVEPVATIPECDCDLEVIAREVYEVEHPTDKTKNYEQVVAIAECKHCKEICFIRVIPEYKGWSYENQGCFNWSIEEDAAYPDLWKAYKEHLAKNETK